MRYVEARIDEFYHNEAYRFYISESLHLAPQNKYLQSSYRDMVRGMTLRKTKPQKTGEEIVLDIFNRAGLKFG